MFEQFIGAFHEQNINMSHSVMNKLLTTQSYSINKLNESLEIFPEFSRFSMIFLNFSNFSLIFQVFSECCEPGAKGGRRLFALFFENRKNANFGKNALIVSIIRLQFSFKM